MKLIKFFDFPSFFHPMEDTFVQVVNFVSFLTEQLSRIAAPASAPAIDGHGALFVKQVVHGKGKSCFVLHINVEAARNVPFRKFGYGSYPAVSGQTKSTGLGGGGSNREVLLLCDPKSQL